MKNRKTGRAVDFLALLLLFIPVAIVAAENPQLSVTHAQTNVLLAWPHWATNWVLEQAPHLRRPVPWTRLSPGLYQTNSLDIGLNLIPGQSNRFYRLRKLSQPVAGLSGYWRLDEPDGRVAEDENPGGPQLFFTNASPSTGRVGTGAMRFNGGPAAGNGTRAWVSNTNYWVLPPPGLPFTASLWFSLDALTPGWSGLLGNNAVESNGWYVAIHTLSPGTNYLVFASPSLNATGRTLLVPQQWYDLAVTYDGTHGNLYLNGNLLAREAGTPQTHEGPIYIGGGVGGFNSFLGRIDEVRTYATALSAEQVSLTGHWSFDDDFGSVAKDSSVNGHHAHVSDTAWVPGKLGFAVDVSSNCVTIPNEHFTVLPPTGGPFSISLWLFPYSLAIGRNALVSSREGLATDWQVTLERLSSGETLFRFDSMSGSGTLIFEAPVVLDIATWTKFDITHNGGITTLYVNGRKVHHASGAIQGSRGPIVVGGALGMPNFNGLIDELKIHRRERAASEIGPVAQVMWETVLRNTSTNIVLKGSGPAGKTLTYSILGTIMPTNGSLAYTPGSPIITYHAGARKGPDALVYTVSDGEFTSIPATLGVSVVQPHWLAPNGGSIPPLDGSRPEQAWIAGPEAALDAIWKTNAYYDCFYYAAGTYHTSGWKYGHRPTARPGCKHIGSGSKSSENTTIKLVNIMESWDEETIFGKRYAGDIIDDFEVHNLVLDCNAANNPKYARGESNSIRIPLARRATVQSLTLHWNIQSMASIAGGAPWQLGPASDFRVCTRLPEGDSYVTNCTAQTSNGNVDNILLDVATDELIIHLDRRTQGIDHYSLAEIQVQGAEISLPSATVPDGSPSSFIPGDPAYSILRAVDQTPGTTWVSDSETNVQIFLPLDPATTVTALNLHWHCRTIDAGAKLGPAADYIIRARDPNTQAYYDVPFEREPRTPEGAETNTFVNPIQTDGLLIVLIARESGTDYYSLREISLQNGSQPVPLRLPSTRFTLPWGSYSVLSMFDGAPETSWASFTQGGICALNVLGNNLKFTHLKVIGFGTKAGKECFPFYIVNFSLNPVGNILVEDCLFTEPATNNADGASVLVLTGNRGSLTNAIVRRCTVRNVRSHFRYSVGFGAMHVENSLVEDCDNAIYYEPDFNVDDLGPVLIRSNQFINVKNGILLRFHPGRQFSDITYVDNEVVLDSGGGWAFSACDVCGPGPSGSIKSVVALNNIVRYADWSQRPGNWEGGLLYSDIRHAVFCNNVVTLGTSHGMRVRLCPAGSLPEPIIPQPCPPYPPKDPEPPQPPSHPPCLNVLLPGYRRTWVNNRDLFGNSLEARFHNSGVDGPALQQQPPPQVP